MHQCTWNFILPRIICKHPERSEKIWKSQSLIHDSSMIRFNSFVTSSNHLSTSILANSRFVARIDGSIIAEVESLKIHFRAATNFVPSRGNFVGMAKVLWWFMKFDSNYGKIPNLVEIWFIKFSEIMRHDSEREKVGRLLDEVDKLNSRHPADTLHLHERMNRPPNRNKIPRSQNRLMWQSGFTVTAGRPFRVGR